MQSWRVWNVVLDNGANSGGGFIREGVELVFLHFDDPHDVVLSMVTSYGAQFSMTTLQFWLLSIVTRDGTPVNVGSPGQWIVAI